jgi:septal ring factor EnvC (AmiA/AmiB activator)
MKVFVIIIFTFLYFGESFGQSDDRDYEEELRYQNDAINALKTELKQLRLKIKTAESRERSTVNRLSSIDKEISLTNKLIQSLKYEEGKARKTIYQLKEDILKNENELESLRIRYKQRVLKSYKKGNLTDLEKVFSSTTWRQAIYRSHYLKLISNIEKKLTKKIEKVLVDISRQKVELEVVLRDNLNLKRDKQSQITSYRNMRINREKELNRVRNDKNALKSYVSEKEEGVQQLEKIIKRVLEDKARFERELRIRQQQETLKTKSFKALKGQLPWPADGRIISKFGRQWNPKLKTTTENPGVDIKGKPGSSIRTVLGGVVTTITYIRGYGTTIIVDHGGGFYTVYSHVTNIQTNVDSQVRNGDVIAYMGDSGSINGSKLHFEIWGKGQKLDPEKWLRKK